MVLHCGHTSAVLLWFKFKYCSNKCMKKFFGYIKYYSATEMLLTLGLPSFDTVIHNYRKSLLCVWSKHSNDLVKLLWCESPSAFFMSFTVVHRTSFIECIVYFLFLLWLPYGIWQAIIFLPCGFFFFLFFPRLISAVCLPYFHTWCSLSANLGCRSETCCTWLTENTERKKSPKNCQLGAITQLCQAISLQLRHVWTIGKKTCLTAISPPEVPTIWWTSAH